MGVINTYLQTDMTNASVWYGQVYSYTSSYILISDGYHGGAYFGSGLTYSGGRVVGGILTGYDSAINVNSYTFLTNSYTITYSARGFSLDAATAYNYIQSGNAMGFQAWALSGNDTLTGSVYSDHLITYNGNDIITGGMGSDIIDGGVGTDTSNYSGSHNNYTITKSGNNFIVADNLGSDGIDTLVNVEVLQFSDTTNVLAPSNSTTEFVALLYQAALGRTPDASGLSNWNDLANGLPGGTSSLYNLSDLSGHYNGNLSIAGGFTNSPEFITKYGPLSNTQFVTQLYANVLDRTPDQAGLNDWLSQLNQGQTREHILVGFAESNEAIMNASVGFVGQASIHHEAWMHLG